MKYLNDSIQNKIIYIIAINTFILLLVGFFRIIVVLPQRSEAAALKQTSQTLETRAQEAETKAGALNHEKQNLLKDINIISDTVSKNASTETIEIKQRNIREIIQKVTAVPDYELTYGIKTFAFMESLSGTLNIKNIKISDFLNISTNICSNRRALTESITIDELSDTPTLISYSFYSPSGKINLNEILKK